MIEGDNASTQNGDNIKRAVINFKALFRNAFDLNYIRVEAFLSRSMNTITHRYIKPKREKKN